MQLAKFEGKVRWRNARKEYLTKPGKWGKASSRKWPVISEIERSSNQDTKTWDSTMGMGSYKQPGVDEPARQGYPQRQMVEGLCDVLVLWTELYLPKSYVKALIPNVTLFARTFMEVIRFKWSHKGRALIQYNLCPYRKRRQNIALSSPARVQWRQPSASQKELLTRTQFCQPLELWEN